MENSKFSLPLVIPLIFTTCIYISTGAQNFKRDGGVNYAHFVKNPSHRLSSSILVSLMVNRPVDCTYQCINNQECYSVNFATTLFDGRHSCELLSTDKFHNLSDLVRHENGYDHYNIKTPCMSNPCGRGTEFCRPIYNRDDYECVCKTGFTGKFCEVEICSVAPDDRIACGLGGISKQQCLNKGCCFNSNIVGVIWCFYGNS